MGHIFISYSRRDGEFAYRLREALIEVGQKPWLDKEKIPPSDIWLARIEAAIDAAEAVVFVLSPASLTSEVCGRELDYAFSHNKRVIPVVWRDPEGEVRGDVAEINYVFLREGDEFEAGLAALTEAIETDLDWVKAHTRLLVRAVEWDRLGRDVSYTLRGRDLHAFEDWAARGQDMKPRATALQTEYLLASRRAVTRRQRILWSAGALALMVAAVLGTVAWFQSAERARQAEIAAARALLSRSEAARDAPRDEPTARSSYTHALRLAAQALDRLVRAGAPVADADLALRKSYANLGKWRHAKLPDARIVGSGFAPGGRFLAQYRFDGNIVVRDTLGDTDGPVCRREPRGGESDVSVSVDARGARVALAFGTRGDEDALNAVEVWDMQACARLIREPLPMHSPIQLSRDGRVLLAVEGGQVRVRDLDSGASRALPGEVRAVRRAAFSPDAGSLVLYSRERGSRDSTVQVVDSRTGEVRVSAPADGLVRSLDWVAGGVFVSQRGEGMLHSAGLEPVYEAPLPAGELVAVSEDGRFAAAATRNGQIGVVDLQAGEIVASDRWRDGITRLAFGPDGRSIVVAGDYYRFLSSWYFLDRGAYAVLEAGVPAEGLRFVDGRLEAWAGAVMGAAAGIEAAVWALSADGAPRLIADTLSDSVPVASPPEASSENARPGPEGGWDMAVARARSGMEAAIVAGEITRAGPRRRLVVRQGGVVEAGRDYEPVLDPARAGFLAYAGNDRYLVVGTREALEIVDADTLEPVSTVYHANAIRAGVSADGQSAVTMDRRGRIKVWDVALGTQRLEIETGADVAALALDDDGRWLAGLTPAGQVWLWALAPGDLIAQACRWLADPCP